jgi:hypothetical protein
MLWRLKIKVSELEQTLQTIVFVFKRIHHNQLGPVL